jgi:DNA replication protein DnaC
MACEQCSDTGFVVAEGGGLVRECECRRVKMHEYKLKKSGVPDRYLSASFETFETKAMDKSVERAALLARSYVENYKTLESRNGLLFTGTVGTGKTHLSLAVIRELRLRYGADTLFVDFRDLLTKIKATFDGGDTKTEQEVLRPVLHAEVLVLDELGAARATDWTFDKVEHIINTRYNASGATIVTTNLINQPPGWTAPREPSRGYAAAAAQAALTAETLGDRIGTRMYSRLQQMCTLVEVRGEDYRTRRTK